MEIPVDGVFLYAKEEVDIEVGVEDNEDYEESEK